MKDEKETREKLLIYAKQEFMEKGYTKASLRNICKNAGVTTGALYFFFTGKEDLFASLVQKPLDMLYDTMMKHYQEEILQLKREADIKEDYMDDIEAAKLIIHYLYQYYEEFQLILTKSQGSGFENSIDRFVSITEQHYRTIADIMTKKRNVAKVDNYMIHWMAHMHIDVFVHMITHELSEKEAINHMNPTIRYLMCGWYGMLEEI